MDADWGWTLVITWGKGGWAAGRAARAKLKRANVLLKVESSCPLRA